jgi:GNAT superfamily N-acetyltransferase
MLSDGFHDVPRGKVAMVVTDLEMTTPQSRECARPDGLDFGPLEVTADTYRDLFCRIGAPWLWFSRMVLDDAALNVILNDDQVHLYTLRKNGQPKALLELDFRTKSTCELAYFGVTPELIGKGAGAYLMDRAIELAFAAPIQRFHLHTCTIDSPQALGFYQRSGFLPIRQQIEIADDPRLTMGYDRTLAPHVPIFDP